MLRPIRRILRSPFALFVVLILAGASLACAAERPRQMEKLEMPAGFEIEVWAEGVTNARQMALSPNGIVYVGSRQDGGVRAVVDGDGDGRPDRVVQIASDLYMPSGIAWRDGALWVAEVNRILRYDGIDARIDDPPQPVVVNDRLPNERHHGWKFIAFGPDGRLYVPVGVPCNVCEVEDPFGTILAMNPANGEYEVFARGVRNSVGFDWNPATEELWFTDNGRDMMGDDVPPDELNRAPKAGLHFGFPFCHGSDVPDPEYGHLGSCADITKPAQELGPHVAALGMRFYDGDMFPERYRGQPLIAEHGSWNRSVPIGYRITVVRLDEQSEPVEYEPLVSGWLQDGRFWGRPADVLVMPDGSLLISDDVQGVLYRLSYDDGDGGS